MTNALDLITDSLQDAGIISANETPTATDGQKCFRLLQRMLDGDSTEDLMIYNQVTEVFPLTNQQMYTIGPTGDFATTRPIDVTRIYMRDTNGNDLGCNMLTYEEYADILSKPVTATIALSCWYNSGYPNSELWLWPVPSSTSYRIVVWSWKQLAALTSITDTLVFPPGYEDYLESNLAQRICVAYNRPLPQELSVWANESKNKLKRLNINVPILPIPPVLSQGQDNSTFPISPHIYTGY